ncbi:hypothetical protein SDC9_80177 [bioreactor metagenome]|uniref:Uncharacterized protein n=1 Tax=bioreactor metagenome TaxID=1076179 RepID=A0A644YYA6_9ZZZZ
MSKLITAYVGTPLEINECLENGKIQHQIVDIDACYNIYKRDSPESAHEYYILFQTNQGTQSWVFRKQETRNKIFSQIMEKHVHVFAVTE